MCVLNICRSHRQAPVISANIAAQSALLLVLGIALMTLIADTGSLGADGAAKQAVVGLQAMQCQVSKPRLRLLHQRQHRRYCRCPGASCLALLKGVPCAAPARSHQSC